MDAIPQSFAKTIQTIKSRPNFAHFTENPNFIPSPPLIFQAYKLVKSPENVRIVILGQDPYPRAQSAAGISFLDLQSTDLADKKQSVSMRNILKSILTSQQIPYTTMQDVRNAVSAYFTHPKTLDFFQNLAENCGVFFLNASLTYADKHQTSTHTAFWRPIIEATFDEICEKSPGVVFVLMGEFAARYSGFVRESATVKVVRSCHPMIFRFLAEGVFERIRAEEEQIGNGVTDFVRCEVKKI